MVACLIGIVGILIFAVPAGLVANGFRTAIDKELRKKHLKDIGDKLKMAFVSIQDFKTMYETIPRYISVISIQANKNMTEKDVIEAVEFNDSFRLRNLATAEIEGKHSHDKLVIEMFPFNQPYGALIDRSSNITIVCPSAAKEAGMGNFGYYLALIGGFNYVSKEIDQDVHRPISYYLINDENSSENLKKYLDDLKKLSNAKDKWTIFLVSSDRQSNYDFHFITKAWPKATGRESTVVDMNKFTEMYEKISNRLEKDFELKCELNEEYRPVGSKNISTKIGGGLVTNTFSIRISNEVVVWHPYYISICKDIAMAINDSIGIPNYVIPEKKLKKEVYEYYLE